MEAATCAALEPVLAEGSTSVGTRVQVEHLAASPVGARIEVSASSTYVDGRLHRFTVAGRDLDSGKVVGTGEITRVVVDAERFLSRSGLAAGLGTQRTPGPVGRGFGVRCAQALGRLPWFAPFFLRARRLRPVLPIVVLLESVL